MYSPRFFVLINDLFAKSAGRQFESPSPPENLISISN
jgi:hypothetical protein